MERTDGIPTAVSNYVTDRDNFRARYQGKASGLFVASSGGPMAFNSLIDEHAAMVAHLLPDMNLAQWEGFAELVNARLNWMRMLHQTGKA